AKVSPDGGFISKRPFSLLRAARSERWHTLRLEFVEEGAAISLDGNLLRTTKISSKGLQKIGFRSGKQEAYIDNIRIVSRHGGVFRDTFEQPRNSRWVTVLFPLSILLVSLLLFLLLRRLRGPSEKVLLFNFLMFTMVLLVITGLLSGLASHQKQFYPDADERLRKDEAYWRGGFAEQIFESIENEYSPEPVDGVRRLLFVGASQTWGSGAAKEKETFVRRTERLLNKRATAGRFECINMAVSANKIADMERDLLARGLSLEPDIVVVNASNNDIGRHTKNFEKHLDQLVAETLRVGSRVVLIMEPNSLERGPSSLRKFHAIMGKVAERHGVAVIDMHTYLADRYDDGFLWWDWVHMTSYGQRLFAERLVEELEDLGLVELEPVASRKASRAPSSSRNLVSERSPP
ncbi:MAG: SGNH/GDSL hydrolase family protein, partial [Acidobacteriota bacterium]|nr:SGNH/GDSL hydrolase family protein [Acidobacteriota bacterium]